MSKTQPIRPRMAVRATLAFAIVASQYNLAYVQPMVDHAHSEISALEPGATVSLIWVPGAFEIPLAAKLVASQRKFDAILSFGVILQGETAHATLVAQSVTSALQDIALEFLLPVIHEVLLLENEAQARARCLGEEINRGTEGARAAVASARTARELSTKLL
ncbi:MAG TPA: 6,7-dimethyl-8-ribityllumazine synthase [Terrimicrobiaceae bacterium]|nr:6,7-dimethyl-8-ribityllumazine synthase [Terrimicrobiaceae bacterium]